MMTKSDLKAGWMVKLANGSSAIVEQKTEYGDLLRDSCRHFLLSEYNEDLTHKKYSHLDIIKVCEPVFITDSIYWLDFHEWNQIWERQPEPEYTDFMTAADSGRRIRHEGWRRFYEVKDVLEMLSVNWAGGAKAEIKGKWEIEPERRP